MKKGSPGLFIFNCDNRGCNYGTGVFMQTLNEAMARAIMLGWSIGEKDICPICKTKNKV